jgi:regulatory protein
MRDDEDPDGPGDRGRPRAGREPKASRPVTRQWLENATQFYLGRYASSSDNLRRVLIRKAQKRVGPGIGLSEADHALIAETVQRAASSGLIDDRRYAESRVASLMRKGLSAARTRLALRGKGVPTEIAAAAIDAAAPDDLALAQRRRFGPYRTDTPAREPEAGSHRLNRELAAMLRAGFSHAVAKAVLTSRSFAPQESVRMEDEG